MLLKDTSHCLIHMEFEGTNHHKNWTRTFVTAAYNLEVLWSHNTSMYMSPKATVIQLVQ